MKRNISFVILAFTFTGIFAQVPVEKDPFHKTIFENEKVRILDLVVGGSDTTTTHIHSAASVVVFVTKSALAIQTLGEKPAVTNVDAGDVIYRAYDEKPTTHKVWSGDGSVMRCIVVEIKEEKLSRKARKTRKN
jgi:hypothetical protein